MYVVAALDQEEIFRTATVERTLKLMFIYMQQLTMTFTIILYSPFYGEDFNFEVPRDFQFLSFYVYDLDCFGLLRDSKLGKVCT